MSNDVVYYKQLDDMYSDDKQYKATIKLELRGPADKLEFSASGELYEKNGRRYEWVHCGQCIDIIYEKIPNEITERIYQIWSRWHLNSMHAGCIHQREFEKEPYEKHEGHHCDICDYTYGTKWIHEDLPAEIIAEIKIF